MLIPIVKLSDLKKLSSTKLLQMQSCAVSSDGEIIGTWISKPMGGGMAITDDIMTSAEYLASRANIVGGKSVEELLNADVSICVS